MKECPKCNAKNRNDAEFCTECGADLKEVAAQADEWGAAGDFLNKAKEAAAMGAKKAKEAATAGAASVKKAVEEADKRSEAAKAKKAAAGGWDSALEIQGSAAGPKGTNAMFVDQSEAVVSTIGNNYLQNYLLGGQVKKGIGILTQKRFYYKGKNFSTEKEGGILNAIKKLTSTTEEGVVSIDDISFTRFTFTRNTGFLLFGILLLVVAVMFMGMGRYMSRFVPVPLVAALVFFVLYFIKRETLFMVFFPGGGFGFDVRYYPIADIRDFQRQLHLLKDHIKEGGDA